MIAIFGEIELYVQSIVNSHINDGWHNWSYVWISSINSKFLLFYQGTNDVSIDGGTDEVSYPASFSFKALIILIEVGELEAIGLVG